MIGIFFRANEPATGGRKPESVTAIGQFALINLELLVWPAVIAVMKLAPAAFQSSQERIRAEFNFIWTFLLSHPQTFCELIKAQTSS
ncbi:MAG: hypothetical protein RQ753_03015 [Desulfurivibrionaceae bacterium]|nr:hypothetical protein [Desulfurivibrionaceae bacterium]